MLLELESQPRAGSQSRDGANDVQASAGAAPGDVVTLRLHGAWSLDNLAEVEAALAALPRAAPRRVRVDCGNLERLDLSAAWLLECCLESLRAAGASVEFVGARPHQFEFIQAMSRQGPSQPTPALPAGGRAGMRDMVAALGREAFRHAGQTREAVGFFGRIAVTQARALRSARHLRLPSIARHVYETGIQAIPIVALIAFLISVIVAYLGAQQLRTFGAEIFTVDLVAIAVLREMGVLLTAIIVAG
ncbi:MAG: hypothetical protein DIU71_11385, partial [Proteobacteria bacterium]